MEWIELGYIGLFLATFLAATVLPFSSEVIFGSMLLSGFDPFACLIVASTGNWLGGVTTYGLGWIGDYRKLQKWLRVKPEAIEKWKVNIDRYGVWLALLCWVPFLGDPIAGALGFFRTKILPTFFLMFIGKMMRYAALLWFISLT